MRYVFSMLAIAMFSGPVLAENCVSPSPAECGAPLLGPSGGQAQFDPLASTLVAAPAPANDAAVAGLYAAVLGRAPDAAGAAYWSGVIRDIGFDAAAARMRATPEGQAHALAVASDPSGSDPVNALYLRVLGRSITAADGTAAYAYWKGVLDREGPDRAAAAMAGTPEGRAHAATVAPAPPVSTVDAGAPKVGYGHPLLTP